MKTPLTKLIEKWESEMGSYIPNAPIYIAFIEEAKKELDYEKEYAKQMTDLLIEYIGFLNLANEQPIRIASLHGWECRQEDVDRGIDYRNKISELIEKID